MFKKIIDYLLKYFSALMSVFVTFILLVVCIVGLFPMIFIFGGIEAVLLAVRDDRLPFQH